MNEYNYEDELIDALSEAEAEFCIDDKVIKEFKRESRQKKSDKKVKKKVYKIGDRDE